MHRNRILVSLFGFFDLPTAAEDRAAVIPFSTFPRLAVELTSDTTALGAGLAGLAPEGQTALYDSIMYALYYFAGVRGQRADGRRARWRRWRTGPRASHRRP